MNVNTMKKIDQYAGIPMCMLLDFISRLVRLIPQRAVKEPSSILVMKFFGMGSIIQASPMLRGIRATFEHSQLSFLTFAANRDIVERLGLVDDVLTLRTESFYIFTSDLFTVLRIIRQRRYDIVIDMEFFSKFSTIITYLTGSPIRIGYFLRQLWRGDLLTHQVYYNQHRHISEVFAALVEPVGVRVSNFSLTAPAIRSDELLSISRMMENSGINCGKILVAVNVNASDMATERRWPAENFQRLIRKMLDECDCIFGFIGAIDDAEYVAQVINNIGPLKEPRIINLAGSTSIGELLAFLQRCSLLITNDSGPLHLAASVGVPTVSFFGPETPSLYAPLGEKHQSFYSGVYCSPCLNVFNAKTTRCAGDNICMKALGIDEVFSLVKQRFPDLWNKRFS